MVEQLLLIYISSSSSGATVPQAGRGVESFSDLTSAILPCHQEHNHSRSLTQADKGPSPAGPGTFTRRESLVE